MLGVCLGFMTFKYTFLKCIQCRFWFSFVSHWHLLTFLPSGPWKASQDQETRGAPTGFGRVDLHAGFWHCPSHPVSPQAHESRTGAERVCIYFLESPPMGFCCS